MRVKKGDWIKFTKKVYVGCNIKKFFFIAKIEFLMGSRIRAKYFMRDNYGGFKQVPVYMQPGVESSYFSIKRKAYSNEIFSSITDFKVSQ